MDLPWLDRPKSFAVTAAMAELTKLGCVERGAITPAGVHLFSLPLDVELARLLTAGTAAPGLGEPTLLLAAALSAGRSVFRRSEPGSASPSGPPNANFAVSGDDLRASGCDAVALIEAVRAGDANRHGLDMKALGEARAAAARFRKLGFGDPKWNGQIPRRAFAELLMEVWPGSAHIRRDQKKRRFTWAAGGPEMELAPDSAVRQPAHEAIIVLDSRAVASDGRTSGLIITAAMPVPIAWLAAAGLGEDRYEQPDLHGRDLMMTVSKVYAGHVLSTREEAPKGHEARLAIRDLTLAGRCFKGVLTRLKDRYEQAGLAVQVALTDRNASYNTTATPEQLPPLSDWLLKRLEDLGLESGADLGLIGPDDIMPPEPPPDIALIITRNYPKDLNIADAKYRIEYQLSERAAIFHQVSGSRKDAPSAMHLPNLVGLRLYWEHKNRVQPILGRS